MRQINLKSEGVSSRQVVENKAGTFSIILGLMVLLLSSGAYGALYYLTQKAKSDTEATKQSQSEKKKQLESEEYAQLYQFEGTLSSLRSRLETKAASIKKLDVVAAYTLPEVVVTGVTIDAEGAGISLTAPDYDVLSRQVKAYSSIEGVRSCEPTSAKKKGENDPRVEASIKIGI